MESLGESTLFPDEPKKGCLPRRRIKANLQQAPEENLLIGLFCFWRRIQKGTQPLRLDEEAKKINQGLERAKNRDQFQFVIKWAVTDDDLRRALLDHKPEIVHFSGHGTGSGKDVGMRDLGPSSADDDSGGLAFENDKGTVRLIPSESLARLFELCADFVKCVVLNACYSEVQASAISKHIDYVVGMKKAIGDEAAIQFAVGFYDATGAGEDFERAVVREQDN